MLLIFVMFFVSFCVFYVVGRVAVFLSLSLSSVVYIRSERYDASFACCFMCANQSAR